jgi:hypothetical protein
MSMLPVSEPDDRPSANARTYPSGDCSTAGIRKTPYPSVPETNGTDDVQPASAAAAPSEDTTPAAARAVSARVPRSGAFCVVRNGRWIMTLLIADHQISDT